MAYHSPNCNFVYWGNQLHFMVDIVSPPYCTYLILSSRHFIKHFFVILNTSRFLTLVFLYNNSSCHGFFWHLYFFVIVLCVMVLLDTCYIHLLQFIRPWQLQSIWKVCGFHLLIIVMMCRKLWLLRPLVSRKYSSHKFLVAYWKPWFFVHSSFLNVLLTK